MTREHKLALIVGFSLVMVLAVLFSDHLSKARAVEQSSELQVAGSKEVGASPEGLKPPVSIIESESAATSPAATRVALPGVGDAPASPAQPATTQVAGNDGLHGVLPPMDPQANVQTVSTGGTTSLMHEPDQFDMAPDQAIDRRELPRSIVDSTELVSPVPVVPKTIDNRPVSTQAMKRHDVKDGDSVYAIAKSTYGDGTLWTKLRDFNKGKINENGSMRAGVTIMLPPKDVLLGAAVMAPDARLVQPTTPAKPTPINKPDIRTPAKPTGDTRTAKGPSGPASGSESKAGYTTYTVKKGDILAEVARRTLGSPNKWKSIADANPSIDPDVLKVGQQLRIPAR